MLTAGETWLEVEVPFLNLPVIKQLDEVAISTITDALFNQLCLVVDIEAIALVDAAHESAYVSAALQLKVVLNDKGIGSPEYASQKAAALAALSKWTDINP